MAYDKLNLSFSEDPAVKSGICVRCGKNAEIHLSLLGEGPQRCGSFCLSCGEAVIHGLQKQYMTSTRTDTGDSYAERVRGSSLHKDPLHDDIEDGIIFWEGHGWSSDGPFAGA